MKYQNMKEIKVNQMKKYSILISMIAFYEYHIKLIRNEDNFVSCHCIVKSDDTKIINEEVKKHITNQINDYEIINLSGLDNILAKY